MVIKYEYIWNNHILQPNEGSSEDGANKTLKSYNASRMTYSDCEEENMPQISSVVNKRT